MMHLLVAFCMLAPGSADPSVDICGINADGTSTCIARGDHATLLQSRVQVEASSADSRAHDNRKESELMPHDQSKLDEEGESEKNIGMYPPAQHFSTEVAQQCCQIAEKYDLVPLARGSNMHHQNMYWGDTPEDKQKFWRANDCSCYQNFNCRVHNEVDKCWSTAAMKKKAKERRLGCCKYVSDYGVKPGIYWGATPQSKMAWFNNHNCYEECGGPDAHLCGKTPAPTPGPLVRQCCQYGEKYTVILKGFTQGQNGDNWFIMFNDTPDDKKKFFTDNKCPHWVGGKSWSNCPGMAEILEKRRVGCCKYFSDYGITLNPVSWGSTPNNKKRWFANNGCTNRKTMIGAHHVVTHVDYSEFDCKTSPQPTPSHPPAPAPHAPTPPPLRPTRHPASRRRRTSPHRRPPRRRPPTPAAPPPSPPAPTPVMPKPSPPAPTPAAPPPTPPAPTPARPQPTPPAPALPAPTPAKPQPTPPAPTPPSPVPEKYPAGGCQTDADCDHEHKCCERYKKGSAASKTSCNKKGGWSAVDPSGHEKCSAGETCCRKTRCFGRCKGKWSSV